MIRSKKTKKVLIITAVLLVGIIFFLIGRIGEPQETERTKIGFVMSGSIDEQGWNGMHYQGIKTACEDADVELLIKENVAEFSGQCATAIKELVDDGVEMIILSSYGYSEEVRGMVKDYPEVVFYVNSSEYHEKNMTSYFVRMYQARYLSGILAGMRTKTNVVGYVAAMENNEVNRGINAFTLGVKKANPDAKVVVSWTGEWDNKDEEMQSAKELIQQRNVDVLTYHQNQGNVIEAAETAGIDSIGYHVAFEDYSEHYLTSVICSWEVLYREVIKEFLQGRGNSVDNFWIGIEREVVNLSEYSDFVTDEMKAAIENARKEILSGKKIFSGNIYDTEGTLRCKDGEAISDEMLLEHFDWFVEGVEFYEEIVE